MSLPLVDVTILGGGPVGLFASFYAGLRGMSVRIIDSLHELGGQLTALYPEKYVYDMPGFPKVLAKELAREMAAQGTQFDPCLVLGETALRVPNVGVFQLRAWDVPFAELDSVTHARKGGSTTNIVLTLSGGGVRTFPANFVSDRYEVIEAIERRIADGHREIARSPRA